MPEQRQFTPQKAPSKLIQRRQQCGFQIKLQVLTVPKKIEKTALNDDKLEESKQLESIDMSGDDSDIYQTAAYRFFQYYCTTLPDKGEELRNDLSQKQKFMKRVK